MLEKVPSLSLDQQNREQKVTVSISISGIYNWWKKRKEKNLKEQTAYWLEDYNPKEEKENGTNSGECVISAGSFASTDQIDQRIDEAIARANGERYGEGEKRSCSYDCVGCNRR